MSDFFNEILGIKINQVSLLTLLTQPYLVISLIIYLISVIKVSCKFNHHISVY